MKQISRICLLVLVVAFSSCKDDDPFFLRESVIFKITTDSEKCYEIAVVGGSTRSSALPGVFDAYSTADIVVVKGLSKADNPQAYKKFKAAESPWHYAREIIFSEGVKCNIYERGGKPFQKLIYTFTQDDIQPNSIFLYENWEYEIDTKMNHSILPLPDRFKHHIYTYKFTPPEPAEE